MATTFTLAQAKLLGLDDLQAGIAETISTEAPDVGAMPFRTVAGNAHTYNREVSHTTAHSVAADGTITASEAPVSKLVTVQVPAISGQSDIPNALLRQAVGENGGNDLRAIHLNSAAKGVAREFSRRIIHATNAVEGFDGFNAVLASADFAGQIVDAAGEAFDFDMVDDALVKLTGSAQFIMGNGKSQSKFRAKMRASGGVTSVELNGKVFSAYEDIPYIRNDYMADGELIMGSWDDGSESAGAACLTTGGDLFKVEILNTLENKDATRIRVIMDGAFAIYSPKKVALLKNFI